MQIVSLVWGVLAFLGMVIGLLPCFAVWSRLNIPFAGVGVILSIVALATAKASNKGIAIAALVSNGVAFAIGLIALLLGRGTL